MILISLYYLLFFIIFWSTRNNPYSKKAIRPHLFLAFILLFIFLGFRDLAVLNDTPHYYAPVRDKMSMGNSLGWFDISLISRIEPGYQIFENIIAKVFSNPYWIIIITSFLITLANIKFFKINRDGLFLCLFLMLNFQLENQYSAIRQGLATIIFYYGFTQYLKGNWKVFVGAVLLATTFHITAIMMLLLLPLSKLTFNKKTIILFILAFFIIAKYLIEPIVGIFSTDNQYLSVNEERESLPIASLVFSLLNLWLFYLSRKISAKYHIEVDNKQWMSSAMCLLISFMDFVFPIIGRVSMYLFPILVLTFVQVIMAVPERRYRDKTILSVFFVFFLWFITYNLVRPDWYNLYPYSFMNIDNIYMYDEVR